MANLRNALALFIHNKIESVKNFKFNGKKTLLRIALPVALVLPTSAIVAVPAWACNGASPVSVTSTTPNGNYSTGNINIQLVWGTSIGVPTGGVPYVNLNLGAVTRRATYESRIASKTLNFTYAIQAGDTSADLQYVATNSLVLNGATLLQNVSGDPAGCYNPGWTAGITLPALNGSSLATNKNISINGVAGKATVSTLTGLTAFEHNEGSNIISANAVNLSPSFSSSTTLYTASLRNDQTGIWVNATWTGTGETATVSAPGWGPFSLTSGTSIGKIPVSVGVTDISVKGFAEDGSSTTYTIRATRAGASENRLTGLALNNGLSLSPTFDSNTVTYSVAAANETSTVNITPTWAGVGETATATFGGSTYALTSGSQLATAMSLNVGANTLVITGYAQNGTTRTYTTTITRAPSSVSTLSALSLNNGLVLSPSFAAATTTYSVAAANETSTVNITPTWVGVGETATATFGGSTYALTSGSQLATAISLNVGANTLTIKGYAASGATTTYTTTITRAPSSVSTLSALALNNGLVLSPSFAAATTTYSVAAANETSTVSITPTWVGVGETATATFGGSTYALTSGSQLATAMSLNVGANTLTIKGYAASGATTTYTTTITRAASSVSTLSALALNNGLVLSPNFAAATTSYTVAASAETSTVFFTPTWIGVGETATANFNGTTYTLASGVLFDMPVDLGFGTTVLTIKGYAASGAITTYTITFTRATSSISTLSALSLSNGLTLSPSFASATTSYTVTAPNSTSTVSFTPTWGYQTGETVTATIGGVVYALTSFDSGSQFGTAVPLNFGANTLYIDGYASNGTSTRYTITINRPAATVSALTALTFTNSSITLAPTFDSATVTYAMTVPFTTTSTQVTGTWTGTGETATATFGGNTYALTSGTILATAIPLTAGAGNIVTVKGFAQDGSTTTYTVTITRTAAATVSSLSALTFTNTAITLAPTFAAATTTYAMTVPYTTSSTQVTGTWTGSFETATATFNGTTYSLTSGTILATAIPLSVGANVVTVKGFAQNGTSTTYTITITRTAASTVSALRSISFNAVWTVRPATYSSSTYTYSGTTPYGVGGSVYSNPDIYVDCIGTESATVTISGASTRATALLTLCADPVDSYPTSLKDATTNKFNVGVNVVTVVGYAQDGSKSTYVFTITKTPLTLSTPAAPTLTAVSESTTAISVNYSASQVSNTSVYSIGLYLASNDSLTATVQQSYSNGVVVFSGLTPNTGYYAKVTAIGSGNYGNSAAGTSSTTVSTNALPVSPTISVQPGSVRITSGNTTSFSVTTARTDGGTLSYQWQVAPSVTGSFANVSGGSVSSSDAGSTYTTPTLTIADTGKAYRVLVYNTKNGATTASAVTSDSATATVGASTLSTPAAPTLSAVSESTTAISVNYSASQVSNTTVYSIALYLASNDSLTATVQETYDTGLVTFSGLTPNTGYYAKVSAIGSGNYGNSAAGTSSTTVSTNALPVAPTISSQPASTTVFSGSTTSFSVTTARTDGGTLSYQWQVAPSVTGTFANVVGGSVSSSNTGSTYTTPVLTVADNGEAYRVLVYNTKNGATTASAVTSDSATATVGAITLSTPAAPTLSAVSESTTAISVNYSASQVSNTSIYSITLYLASNNSVIQTVQQSYSSGVLVFSGLTPNTGYYAKVTGIGSGNYGNSAAGTSSTTVSTNALPVTPTISVQPGSVSITSGNTTSFSVTTARTDGGTLSYQWQVAANDSAPYFDIDEPTSGNGSVTSTNTGSTYTTPTLTYLYDSGKTYRVLVYNTKNGARSAAVVSDWVRGNVAAIKLTKPSAPTGSAVAGSATSASLTYTSVSNASIYAIKVYRSSDNYVAYDANNTFSTGTVVITGLAAGTTYYATITANGSGNYSTSDASNSSATFRTNSALTAPTLSGSATSGTLKSIDLTWGSATANATGYLVRIYNSAGTSLLESITVSSAATTSQSITSSQYASIADGTSYKFAIVALGGGEYLNSSESEMISISTNSAAGSISIATQPQAASKIALQSAEFSVSATGDGTLSYQWQVSSDSGTVWSNVTSGTGGTSATYTTASLETTANGYLYRVAISNTKNGSTSTTNSDEALLSVAFANQAPLVISTLEGRTEVALTLRASGGSSGGAISYTTSTEGCTINGAAITRTTYGSCVVIATRAGNATVYNDVQSQASTVRFLLGDGNVDLTFDGQGGDLAFEYQAAIRVVIAVVESGKVQVLQDGRPVPGCTTLKATPTAPAVCLWKPSSFGYPNVTAILTPNNTANPPRRSAVFSVKIIPRY